MTCTAENHVLSKVCERLGIGDTAAIRKAAEYLRLYQSKGGLRALNDYAKTVMCIDLACSQLGNKFDKETAIKLSGMKKTAYQTNLHSLEKMLNLNRPLTVAELCVQLGCTSLKPLANQIFDKYMESDSLDKDDSHPQYVTAAVYTACKLKQIKIEKSQFVTMSRLKPSQWKEVETKFAKFAESSGIEAASKAKTASNKNDFIAYVEELTNNKDEENERTLKRKQQEDRCEEQEDYESWKNRILEEATRALKNK